MYLFIVGCYFCVISRHWDRFHVIVVEFLTKCRIAGAKLLVSSPNYYNGAMAIFCSLEGVLFARGIELS